MSGSWGRPRTRTDLRGTRYNLEAMVKSLPIGTEVAKNEAGSYEIKLPLRYVLRNFAGATIIDAITATVLYVANGQSNERSGSDNLGARAI